MIRALVLVLVVVVLILQAGLTTPTRVSIVRPIQIVNEYAHLRYQVQVDPHAENRALVLAAVDTSLERATLEDATRLTSEQLDGEHAPRTRWVEWKYGLPAGDYVVVAVLYSGIKNEIARASVPVTVLARF